MLALATTLLAVPTIWLFVRDGDDTPDTVVTADVPVVEPFDPIGDVPSVLELDGRTPPPSPPAVVVGTETTQVIARVKATYTTKASNVGSQRCAVDAVPSGEQVTIVNVANGRSTRCRTIGPTRDDGLLVLHSSDFEKIALLVDAPIHVEIRQ